MKKCKPVITTFSDLIRQTEQNLLVAYHLVISVFIGEFQVLSLLIFVLSNQKHEKSMIYWNSGS